MSEKNKDELNEEEFNEFKLKFDKAIRKPYQNRLSISEIRMSSPAIVTFIGITTGILGIVRLIKEIQISDEKLKQAKIITMDTNDQYQLNTLHRNIEYIQTLQANTTRN